MDPVKCPRCGSTSWTRLEDGTEHSEDVLDTATGKASETEDDHANTDTRWECFGCDLKPEDLDDAASSDGLWQRLDDALTEAVWT